MRFEVPGAKVGFEIPDEWWLFTEMNAFTPSGVFYQPSPKYPDFDLVPITDIEPPTRDLGYQLFKKYKMVPVLLAFLSQERPLPPVDVVSIEPTGRYRLKVVNGCHRYYASIAVGYTKLPVVVR
jgi:hypothetical protein